MKKLLSILLITTIGVLSLTGCGGSAGTAAAAPAASGGNSLKIVATIFPEYDWVRNILGEHAADADLTLLVDNGADLHSFQPTADDILTISTADLFVYVGGESDQWVSDALKQAVNQDMVVIDLLDVLGEDAKEEEIVEGMEAEHDHEDADHDHEEEPELDEHVWLSLRNAGLYCGAITDALSKLDPANADSYAANNAAYQEKLTALDQAYRQAVDASAEKTLLFGDRFPFRYLTDDYGLTYYAAFVGCSAETEASFETVVFLANKVDELSLPVILTIEGKDHRIAETIRDNTADKDLKILSMDSMQSVTASEIAAGADYLKIMEQNLEVLKQALAK
ncbi:MAG: zinc ABC transporter substrate-binding protein [Lachnospiraceae bacterium]|nr:zinc ABC transporter substrate-binding protein [Lachnospiraceae bacterium]